MSGSPISNVGSSAGPLMIVVIGPAAIVHVCVAGDGSTLPSMSMARTRKVCGPTSKSSNSATKKL